MVVSKEVAIVDDELPVLRTDKDISRVADIVPKSNVTMSSQWKEPNEYHWCNTAG